MGGVEHGDSLNAWVAICGALGLFCLLQGVFWLLRGRAQRRGEQLGRRLRGQQEAEEPEGGIKLRRASSDQRGRIERLRDGLERYGISPRMLRWSIVIVVGASVATGLLTRSVAGTLAEVAAAIVGAYAYFASRRARALEQMRAQVPKALELMTFSLRAGHSLEEAVRQAADQVEAPLSQELLRCYQESSMGRPIESTLEQLRQRWPEVRSLRFFVDAVSVLKRSGGNLIEVMDQIGSNLRAQAAFASKHRALTAEGKMSGRILMALPFVALGIQALTAPEQLELMLNSGGGRVVLMMSAVFWVLGALWVNKLTTRAS